VNNKIYNGVNMANQIRCAHILVEKESLAKDILEKINKGESFSKLAEEYSIDGSRKKGGDLGFFGNGVMVKDFEKAAFSLKKGEVSRIVKTQFGYHIIKRLE
jgi:parvulin-like peptidyl-prolyl isomerase